MNQQFNVDQVAFATESMQDTMNTVRSLAPFFFIAGFALILYLDPLSQVSALREANTQQQAMMKEFNMD